MVRRTTRGSALPGIVFRSILMVLFVAAVAVPALADYFTVTLTNGTSFYTRYRPVPADWDENVVMINTDRGNWIGLYADEIADVTSHAEATGFGYQLDTTTLFVGWSPNDQGGDEEGAEGEDDGLDLEAMFPEPAPSGVLQQFVDIPSDGVLAGQPVN